MTTLKNRNATSCQAISVVCYWDAPRTVLVTGLKSSMEFFFNKRQRLHYTLTTPVFVTYVVFLHISHKCSGFPLEKLWKTTKQIDKFTFNSHVQAATRQYPVTSCCIPSSSLVL